MTFRALRIDHDDDQPVSVVDLDEATLDGPVRIAVAASCCNYKDAMVTMPGNKVARCNPLIGGVDLAGTVTADASGTFAPGEAVLVHGYGLGVSHHGGFAELAAVPAEWVVRRPAALDAWTAMAIGTAGFTAWSSLEALRNRGLSPSDGPVLVTGATGGVGAWSVALLAAAGFEVVASSGKASSRAFLHGLGASDVIGRDEVDDRPERVLGTERWAGAIDCVGGATLAQVLRSLRYGAAVAASGLTAGPALATTVYPFITRGVALLGIDAVDLPLAERQARWDGLATDPAVVDAARAIVTATVGLSDVPAALDALLDTATTGRTVVDLSLR